MHTEAIVGQVVKDTLDDIVGAEPLAGPMRSVVPMSPNPAFRIELASLQEVPHRDGVVHVYLHEHVERRWGTDVHFVEAIMVSAGIKMRYRFEPIA